MEGGRGGEGKIGSDGRMRVCGSKWKFRKYRYKDIQWARYSD